ncbi:MAG: AraC family transcriptional regulator [Chitinophagaceae bacterium]|nr:MAG: AraC family transcriptional regulator [Chitinophagaceae bacterium]
MDRRILKQHFSLLHIDHVKLDKRWDFPNVISPYFRIYYIDEGEGIIISEKEKTLLEPGYLYIVPSFTLCHLKCNNYLSQYFLHFFEESAEGISLFGNYRKIIRVAACDTDISNFRKLLSINPKRGINLPNNNPKTYEKNLYYRSYQDMNKRVNMATFLETQGIMLQLLSRFLDAQAIDNADTNLIPSKILEAISYVQLNLKENLSVELLAKNANLHPDYFSRLFFQSTGDRPISFIHEKRIERAQYLIATTNLSQNEIAEETGFDNLPYFSKVFKKITSLTPGEYKKKNQLIYNPDPHPEISGE